MPQAQRPPPTSVEERVHNAIIITRELLMNAFDDPRAVIMMAMDCTKPEDVENQVAMILEYLDKTEPEKEGEVAAARINIMKDLGVDKIKEPGV